MQTKGRQSQICVGIDCNIKEESFGYNSAFLPSKGSEELVVLKGIGNSRAFLFTAGVTSVGFGGQYSFSHLCWHKVSSSTACAPALPSSSSKVCRCSHQATNFTIVGKTSRSQWVILLLLFSVFLFLFP